MCKSICKSIQDTNPSRYANLFISVIICTQREQIVWLLWLWPMRIKTLVFELRGVTYLTTSIS